MSDCDLTAAENVDTTDEGYAVYLIETLKKENAELKDKITKLEEAIANQYIAWEQHMEVAVGNARYILELEKVVNLSKKYVDFPIKAYDEKTFMPQYEARKIIYAELKKALKDLNNSIGDTSA